MDTNFQLAAISTAEAEQYRSQLLKIGNLYGKRIVIPMSDYVDLKHAEKMRNGDNMLTQPIRKYYVETVDILSLTPLRRPDNVIVIIVNGNEKLRFPLTSTPVLLEKKNLQDVFNAFKLHEGTGEITPFSDVQLVTDACNEMNCSNAKKLRELADEYLQQASAIDSINDVLMKSTANYFESIIK